MPAALLAALAAAAAPLPTPNASAQLEYIGGLADWAMTLGVAGNEINSTVSNRSIFINGNLARLFLAADALGLGKGAYKREALAWCDTLVSIQHEAKTATGEDGGYWATGYGTDTVYGDVYWGDAGTAAQTLTQCWHNADGPRASAYLTALRRFARYVRHGCRTPPPVGTTPGANLTCPGPNGWLCVGDDAGGIGDGWYKGTLNMPHAYTVSTETTALAAFAMHARIDAGDGGLAGVVSGAARWLVRRGIAADGTIPYTISGEVRPDVVYQPISYGAEGIVPACLNVPGTCAGLLAGLRPTVQWAIANQSADGSWGRLGSGDSQRSPRVASLLQWYLLEGKPPPDEAAPIRAALARFASFFVGGPAAGPEKFGVRSSALATGFVGLALADLAQPYVTFGLRPRAD